MYGWRTNCMKKEHWTETGKLRSKQLVAHSTLPHLCCATTRCCRGTSLTRVVFLNLHIFFGPVSLCSFLHSGDSVLSETNCVKKREDYMAHDAHVIHILTRPKGRWGAWRSIAQHTLLRYPPHYIFSQCHPFIPISTDHAHTHACMQCQHKERDETYLSLLTNSWKLVCNCDIKDHRLHLRLSVPLKSVDYLQWEYALSTEKCIYRHLDHLLYFSICCLWKYAFSFLHLDTGDDCFFFLNDFLVR